MTEHDLRVEPKCPVCFSGNPREAFQKNGYDHWSCQQCDALYVFPVPTAEALADYYAENAEQPNSSQCWEGEALHFRHYEAIWAAALRAAKAQAGAGPLLDVGCGGGQFLAFARRQGWDSLCGVELSEPAAELARARSGAEIHSSDFLDSVLPASSQAVVTMWNVIEHAPQPRAFVQEVHRLLRPGGVFIADCPSRRGLTMSLIGPQAWVVMPPEHLTYFSPTALRTLLEAEGLSLVRLASNTIYLNDWLRYLRGSDVEESESRQSYRAWYERVTRSAMALWGIRGIDLLLGATGLGDQMLLVAQKTAGTDQPK